MSNNYLHTILTYFIALVWLINGLFCKVLNYVPRHEQIVAAILGDDFSREITLLIGVSEIFMAMWVLSGISRKLNAMVQIVIVATMNILEFALVPDLLLWGRFNAIFALLFISVIYFHEWERNKAIIRQI